LELVARSSSSERIKREFLKIGNVREDKDVAKRQNHQSNSLHRISSTAINIQNDSACHIENNVHTLQNKIGQAGFLKYNESNTQMLLSKRTDFYFATA